MMIEVCYSRGLSGLGRIRYLSIEEAEKDIIDVLHLSKAVAVTVYEIDAVSHLPTGKRYDCQWSVKLTQK